MAQKIKSGQEISIIVWGKVECYIVSRPLFECHIFCIAKQCFNCYFILAAQLAIIEPSASVSRDNKLHTLYIISD